MLVYAFIPARSGSKGLPDKNILPIDGHPLLAYSVAFGRALGIDRVLLTTDSADYANIARRYGAEVPFLRGAAASGDTAMEEDILRDFADKLPESGIDLPDLWVRLKPTNPFRSLDSVRQAIGILTARDDVDSVRIVSEADARLCRIDADGFLKPLLDDIWDPARSVMRRQEFPTVYSPFNLDILRHRLWERHWSAYMGARIHPIVEHAITGLDINTRDDFDIVRSIVEARPRAPVVEKYLVEPKPVAV